MLQIFGDSVKVLGKLQAVLKIQEKIYLGGWGVIKEDLRSYILQIQIFNSPGLFTLVRYIKVLKVRKRSRFKITEVFSRKAV